MPVCSANESWNWRRRDTSARRSVSTVWQGVDRAIGGTTFANEAAVSRGPRFAEGGGGRRNRIADEKAMELGTHRLAALRNISGAAKRLQ